MTRESDLNDRIWRDWTPRNAASKEGAEWADFQRWCGHWAGWTNITVPYVTQEEASESEKKPSVEDWRTEVYGGKKASAGSHGRTHFRDDSPQKRQPEAQGEAQGV